MPGPSRLPMMKAFAFTLVALTAMPVCAREAFEFWPGSTCDPRIPTFRKVLGYDPGERITPAAGIVRYPDALAAASSRVKVFEYGEAWEGRKLVYAAIGSESPARAGRPNPKHAKSWKVCLP